MEDDVGLPDDAEVAAPQAATGDLVGVALRGLEALDGRMSLTRVPDAGARP